MMVLKDLDVTELEKLAEELGEKNFRGKQLFTWIYSGAKDFDEMKNLPLAFREKLKEAAYLNCLKMLKRQVSTEDGTRKYLFELRDGNTIESVFMKYSYGSSICVSSQAGCNMGCRFCASTIGGKVRDLSAGEIVEQLISVQRDSGERISHIVLMGTGEPFDNYENISKFIRLANDSRGLNIGMRNITVSTCGIVPMIMRFAEDFPQVNLAISLHAPSDEIRNGLMPVNKAYNMSALLAECKKYTEATGRRITFEYALIKDVNDSLKQAEMLAHRLKGMLCHVNLIPLNEVSETGFKGSGRKQAELFRERLEQNGVPSTIRRRLGSDIDAACGQLRLNKRT